MGGRGPHCRMQRHLFSDSVPQDPNFVGHWRQYCAKGLQRRSQLQCMGHGFTGNSAPNLEQMLQSRTLG
jgi:hypothetical protein